MSGSKTSFELSWAPKVNLVPNGTKETLEQSKILPQITVPKSDKDLVDGLFVPPRDPKKLNKLLRKQVKDTAGQKWFDMPAAAITPELKKDLQIVKLRAALDPKRHYKKGSSEVLPKYFQVGTVIEDASEYFSRLTKKQRRPTIADQMLSDPSFQEYRKRKISKINEQLQGTSRRRNKKQKLGRKH
ncbi:hypothetical protein AMTRI_Chr08g209870 [Amborella trichopoda]